jgi:hypothetical protein
MLVQTSTSGWYLLGRPHDINNGSNNSSDPHRALCGSELCLFKSNMNTLHKECLASYGSKTAALS